MDDLPVQEVLLTEDRLTPIACEYCGMVPDIRHRVRVTGAVVHTLQHICHGPWQFTINDAIRDWNASQDVLRG